jgi:hypothetical protein
MQTSKFTKHPERQDAISWEAREVVRDIEGHPQLFLRLELTGLHFAARAERAFMRVGPMESCFVRLSRDGSRALGYFDHALPTGGRIAFGYGSEVTILLHDTYVHDPAGELDRARLPQATKPLRNAAKGP